MITRIRTRHGKWGRPINMTLRELAAAICDDRWQHDTERLERQARDARTAAHAIGVSILTFTLAAL